MSDGDARPAVHPLEGAGRGRAAVGVGIAGLAAGVTAVLAGVRERRMGRDAVLVDAAGGGDFDDLETAVASVPEHTTIHVRAGTYVIERGNMSPRTGVHVVGEGYATHVRLRPGVSQNVFRCEAPHVVLDGLRIDGEGRRQQYASGNGVMFTDGAHGSAVIGCAVERAAGYNIVAFPGCREVVIAGNTSADAVEEGIELQGASGCTVAGNVVLRAAKNGILLWSSTGTCAYNTVTANTVLDSGAFGVLVQDGAHDNTIAANTIAGSAGFGIIVDDTTVSGRDARDTSNPYRAGESRDCFATVVTGNVVTGSGRDGIRLNNVSRCTVSANVVRASREAGIGLASARACLVRGNVVTSSAGPGVLVDGPGATLTDNVVTQDAAGARGEPAIRVTPAGTGAALTGNRCSAPGGPAVEVASAAGPTMLTGNVVDRTGPGLRGGDALHVAPHRRLVVALSPATRRVPHGLGYAPRSVAVAPQGGARVHQARAADAEALYLRASAAGAAAEVVVG